MTADDRPTPAATPADAGRSEPTPETAPVRSNRRRRLVLWISLGTAAAVAALVAVLATSGPAGQASAGSPLIGRKAPPISGPSVGQSVKAAQTVRLSSLAGKWVLVNFAASWCVPCRQEMPQLVSFAEGHARIGDATVLMVEYDEGDLGGLTSWLHSSHAIWPAVDDGQAVVDYGVSGIPESYLVDPQGTVVAKYVGGVVAAQLNTFIARSSTGASS
jgi:cytochrome c biogenesis protein CcmG/thiol:disulfide interchange protein DsbE